MSNSENEWIEWAGGECPVALDARVDVRFRDGVEHIGLNNEAHVYHWQHLSQGRAPNGFKPDHDIIAYRVVSQ
jgi:hypothetical protein